MATGEDANDGGIEVVLTQPAVWLFDAQALIEAGPKTATEQLGGAKSVEGLAGAPGRPRAVAQP